jgi:hypothetical protein
MKPAMVPCDDTVDSNGGLLQAPQPRLFTRARYLQLLTWCFTFFSTVRVLSYLPTLWAIHTSGQSEQHSLLTWCTWLGANLTMAGWLHEHNGQRANGAVLVNLANAAMCALTAGLIAWYRF